MPSGPKIVLIGGGSNSWIPSIVKDMVLTESLSGAEFVLLDIRKKASDLTKAFLDKLAAKLGASARFVSTDNQVQALKGADYVVITISTGRLKSMAHDLAIPQQYGIYHTVGDTSGPGGWARFIRNFDVFVGIARDINRHAPRAVVLNYTNPMATLTDVLCRLCNGPVVGLCHGLFGNLEILRNIYKLRSADQIAMRYAGLNHFFWVTEARAGKRDLVADMKRRLRTRSLSEIVHGGHEDAIGFHSNQDVADELYRQTGVMPYFGDRHICEFFPYYITSRKVMRQYRIVRTTVAQREKGYADREKKLKAMIKGKIPKQYFERSRETAANIIDAHSQGKTFIDVGNVPNVGQVSSLPHGSVLETAVCVDGNGFTPLSFGPLPQMVQAMVEPWAAVYTMIVDACFKKDLPMALQALRMDPVCANLSSDQVDKLGRALLKAHKRYITAF